MALLDDLVSQVPDIALRGRLQQAIADLRRKLNFGLVFEEHIPETTAIFGIPVQVGAVVQVRRDSQANSLYRLSRLIDAGQRAVIVAPNGHEETADVTDLLVVKRFGEPMYAALEPIARVHRGAAERPYHVVVNGENFHALQLFTSLYEKAVDCIYIDPPYNTGARDWKYNNRFVDSNDAWRHSKWLAMMQRRLRLAKRLLKPDSVLIVTVDANEVNHLGLLLEQTFPAARRQIVTICINPSGASGEGLSRVDEYAYFCFLGNAQPNGTLDDMLSPVSESAVGLTVSWESLLRRGNAWYRAQRRNLCYPILIDERQQLIAGVGTPFVGDDEASRPTEINGYRLAWPIRTDGRLGIWRVDAQRLMMLAREGFAYVSSRDEERGTWTIRYLMKGTIGAIDAGTIDVLGRGPRGEVRLQPKQARKSVAKTIWHRGRHTAGGIGGTQMLTALLGEREVFSFPKSIYAVKDCLEIAVGNHASAVILDFFAGSGTTLHSTCLLNERDGGRRQCILVTNNEVDEAESRSLNRQGLFKGDHDFEQNGVFYRVTRPRCETAVTGNRPDGTPAKGDYLDGRPISEGFAENVEFYEIKYLDPDSIEMGEQFNRIHPLLWLKAGAVGTREDLSELGDFYIAPESPYGVLFKPSRLGKFIRSLERRSDVTHVWIVTDSEDAFAEACESLPRHVSFTSQLYRDYLRTFRINGR